VILATILGAVGFLLVGCTSRPDPTPKKVLAQTGGSCDASLVVPKGPLNNSKRKYIYKDLLAPSARGEWSNWMTTSGDSPAQHIRNVDLDDRRHPYGGTGESVRIDFHLGRKDWAGVAVASSPNCWGESCCPAFYDLVGARRLVFHARGGHGGEVIEVKVAILGDKPYGDSATIPATSGTVTLRPNWQRYDVNLTQTNLSRVVTPFSVFASGAHNPSDMEIFLDEIYFEY
jgi:hypothetical protein